MITKKEKAELLNIESELMKISARLWNLSKKKAVNNLGIETIKTLGIHCENHASLIGAVVQNDERK